MLGNFFIDYEDALFIFDSPKSIGVEISEVVNS
jgi:hypothetical protein